MNEKKNNPKENLPDRVSWQVVNSWWCIPPCEYKEPYCNVLCPYFEECYHFEDDYDEDEEWP